MKGLLVFLAIGLSGLLIPFHGTAQERIRLGILPVTDCLPLHVAIQEGYCSQNKVDLELLNFMSALERDAALQSGNLEGYFADLISTMLMVKVGQDITVVASAYHTDPAQRMFGLMAGPKSGISQPRALEGRKVGISSSTIIEFLLDRMTEKAGLSQKVEKIDIRKIPLRLQMLMSGQIDAALVPEPFCTLAEQQGAKALLDDRNLDLSLTIIALRRATLKQNPGMARGFLAAYSNAVTAINKNPSAFKDLLAQKTQLPEQVRSLYAVPVFPSPVPPGRKDVTDVQQWMLKKKLLDVPIPYEKIVADLTAR